MSEPSTLLSCLERAASRGEGVRFLDRSGESVVSYSEVLERARAVAGALASLGVAPGTRVAVAGKGRLSVVALAIERQGPRDEAGSVLFLDPTGALDGFRPIRIDRKVVGANPGARPETLRFSRDGSFLYVASERDGGTLSVIGVR